MKNSAKLKQYKMKKKQYKNLCKIMFLVYIRCGTLGVNEQIREQYDWGTVKRILWKIIRNMLQATHT